MTSQLERLARPFPTKYIKQAPSGHGTYVDHEIVNQALLIILGPFSFEVQQVLYNPDGLLDGCTASLTAVIDGREVTVTEAGDCEHPKNCPSQGDRLKKAASDALKRCAMRLGCGIHLWAQGDFFLHEQLRDNQDAGASEESVTGSRTDASATSPAPESSSPIGTPRTSQGVASSTPPLDATPASPNRVQQLQSKLSAMIADGVSGVAAERQRIGLPKLDENCTADELDGWGDLLNRLDPNLNRVAV